LRYALMVRSDASLQKGRMAALGRLRPGCSGRREMQRQKRVSFSQLCRFMSPLENPLNIPGRYKHLRQVAAAREVGASRPTS
ncbi:MAG: hypothetical protein Q8O86_04100, partial [Dehalococcoidia bacterium]|nr:hypothetical protein [Dehalococcoidia bacterium]